MNPNASEWKPSFTAKAFVPSFDVPAPAAETESAPPPPTTTSAPAPATTPAPTPAPAPAASATSAAPVRVLKLTETKPVSGDKGIAKKEESPKAEIQATAAISPPKAKPTKKVAQQTANQEKTAAKSDTVTEDLDTLDDDVVADLYGKEHLNVVFMGHVDAGKSTMGGNILFLTGMIDKRTMEKYEKEAKDAGRESWYLSFALDTGVEERAKGKTVECGRAFFETDKRRYTILDAPGHKNYVPSMITGASQADVGVMVISARKGEFETGFERGGQTREHTMLAKTSGIVKMVIAINKMDDPTVIFDEIIGKLTPFLKQTGFNPKTEVYFMPVSGYTGANIKDRSSACSWYNGPSLLEYLDDLKTLDRKFNAPLMMPIAETYKDMGTIIVGKIESGHIKKNQAVLLMPNKRVTEISTIYNESEEVEQAMCGDNVKIRIKGVEEDEVSPGFVLCTKKKPVKTATKFHAQLAILEHKNIICAGYTAVLHVHAAAEEVTLGALLHLVDKKTNRKSKRPPQFVKQGQKVIARIETSGPLCVETFDDYPQLGRFTLRDEGKTVAIGKIIKVLEDDA
ncbi:P-loop containing nucleoside triphosphate hydrolase protein [Absidia repens]|uniref:Eukaryotic peptide chain release factor GTP-binding subunit n=1 Tax=Absidia repens TaxID=90262 RepID=A0A1X2IXV4_9FUNG|nr:P-loop containing nucleoside triphosphate hydrolase protein [Absidia repens]